MLWASPTPADQTRFSVKVGTHLTFALAASTSVDASVVHIAPAGSLPKGAALKVADGSTATATFTWIPTRAGDYTGPSLFEVP